MSTRFHTKVMKWHCFFFFIFTWALHIICYIIIVLVSDYCLLVISVVSDIKSNSTPFTFSFFYRHALVPGSLNHSPTRKNPSERHCHTVVLFIMIVDSVVIRTGAHGVITTCRTYACCTAPARVVLIRLYKILLTDTPSARTRSRRVIVITCNIIIIIILVVVVRMTYL